MYRDLCLHASVEEVDYNSVCTDCGLVLGDKAFSHINTTELEINGTGTHVAGGTQTLIGRYQLRLQYIKTKDHNNFNYTPQLNQTTIDTLKQLDMFSGHTREICNLVTSITNKTLCRAKMKQAVIVWCIHYTYKRHNKLVAIDSPRLQLGLSKTHMTKANRLINEIVQKHYPNLNKQYLQDMHPIDTLSDLIKDTKYVVYKPIAKQLYNYLEENHPPLKGTTMSIVKGVFYYTIKHKTTVQEYTTDFQVSKATIFSIRDQIEKLRISEQTINER